MAEKQIERIFSRKLGELSSRKRGTPANFQRCGDELTKLGDRQLKQNERSIIHELDRFKVFIFKSDFADCGDYLDFVLRIVPRLEPITSLQTYFFLTTVTDSSFLDCLDGLPNADIEVEVIMKWLSVHIKIIKVKELLLKRRVEGLEHGNYCASFGHCIFQSAMLLKCDNWNAVDDVIKYGYERKIISFIEKIISKVPRANEADLLRNFVNLADTLATLLKKIDIGNHAHSARAISILNASFNLIESCFEETRFNRYVLKITAPEPPGGWQSVYGRLLFSHLTTFLRFYAHQESNVRVIVAKLCYFISKNLAQRNVLQLVYNTIIQLKDEGDDEIKRIITDSKMKIDETLAASK